MKKFKPYLKYL